MPTIYCIPLIAFAATLTLTACAGSPAQHAESSATANAPADALYARLDADSRRYAAGVELARNGSPAQAQSQMKAALEDLHAAAAQCARTAPCDSLRFTTQIDQLLRTNSGSAPKRPTHGEIARATPERSTSGEATSATSGRSAGGEATSATPEERPTPSEAASATAERSTSGEAASAAPEANASSSESSPTVALPELGHTITLLKGHELSDIIALNEPVKTAIEQWLTQYRPNLMDAYENYQYMRHLMWPEYEKAKLPEALLFGMLAKESGGKVHAISRTGASGPLQFMYMTGLRFGLGITEGFDQRFDPQLSARANAAYINQQLAIFNNNLDLVIAAYNSGEGAMQRRIANKGSGTANFWDPKIYYDVPQETRDYVSMVLAAAWLFMHPERYNLEFPKIVGHPGSITLKRPTSIAELTICLGQDGNLHDGWFRTLRNLNPQLDPLQKEPTGTKLVVPQSLEKTYLNNCVSGRWSELASELQAAAIAVPPAPPPPPPPPPADHKASKSPSSAPATARKAQKMKIYAVVKGDTLASIARKSRCGTSAQSIAAANGLKGPKHAVKPGQTLKIPEC
ncbi:MAG: transglycosylase SLT domain-containing protein [Rhodanobacter sp.]|jgi:membrane-bound lytic murein transglycosylase D|nr:transglycosylase SLT domain-containing protein [Rhodanobacter sp.]